MKDISLAQILDRKHIDLNSLGTAFRHLDSPMGRRLFIDVPRCLPMSLYYSLNGGYIEWSIGHIWEPWLVYEPKEIENHLDKISQEIIEILENNYVLETKGGKATWLHFFDKHKKFKYSAKCVNFPSLVFGKREFVIYEPIIGKLQDLSK